MCMNYLRRFFPAVTLFGLLFGVLGEA
ncbi:MAG: hypothetical protein RL748_1970, partial [Pseudomonadota bacterium]